MSTRRTIYAEADIPVVLVPLDEWQQRRRARVLASARPRLRWLVEWALTGLRLAPYEPYASARESLRYLDPESEAARVMRRALSGASVEGDE